MKWLFLFLGTTMLSGISQGQQLSVSDFLEVSTLSAQKSNSYFSKKGYTPAGKTYQNDTVVDTWQQMARIAGGNQQPLTRRVAKYQYGKSVSFCLQTPFKEEYLTAIRYLKSNGFFCGDEENKTDSSYLFQKEDITVQAYSLKQDSTIYYSLFFHQQDLPAQRSVQYADDLLQFNSHEHLAGFFGRENVRKDIYFFSEKEINKCSVLFPNSTRQVVFIWKDEHNLLDLSYMLIGGNMSTRGSADFNRQIRENTWSLTNGVRFNMRLAELVRLNGGDFSFFGRKSDNFLSVAPDNKGRINFFATGIVLDCLNCNGSSFLNKEMVNASDALQQQLSLYVGMIMLIPTHASKQ